MAYETLASRYVDAGALLTFGRSLPSRNRSDMLDSILLAQLAADKQYSRFDQPGPWYGFYTRTLGGLAWQISAFEGKPYSPKGETFALRDVLLDVLAKHVSGEELALVEETIGLFASLPRDCPPVEVYDRFSHMAGVVNLQAGVADLSTGLVVAGVTMATEQPVESLFGESFLVAKLVAGIRFIYYKATLNETVYAGLRKTVIEKLGERRGDLIRSLESPPLPVR